MARPLAYALFLVVVLGTAAACAKHLPPTLEPEDELPWRTADGWTGTVRHYPGPGEPVLVVHGMGANHYNWDYRPEVSLVPALQERGWDVWVPNLRGDPGTVAPSEDARRDFDFDDHALTDLPAIVGAVLDATHRQRLYWVGHSMGGMLLYTALALYPERVAAGVAVCSPARFADQRFLQKRVRRTKWLVGGDGLVPSRALAKASRILGRANPAWGIVANREHLDWPVARGLVRNALVDLPKAMARQAIAWLRSGQFTRADGTTEWLRSPSPPVPLLVLAGEADRIAPPSDVTYACDVLPSCETRVLGPSGGFPIAYGHIDPVLGTTARTEVFPIIVEWLDGQRAP